MARFTPNIPIERDVDHPHLRAPIKMRPLARIVGETRFRHRPIQEPTIAQFFHVARRHGMIARNFALELHLEMLGMAESGVLIENAAMANNFPISLARSVASTAPPVICVGHVRA